MKLKKFDELNENNIEQLRKEVSSYVYEMVHHPDDEPLAENIIDDIMISINNFYKKNN